MMPTISGRSTSITYNCPICFGAAPTPAQGGPFDLSQSQFIDVKTYSQELRFTSNKVEQLLVDRRRVLHPHRALHLHRQHHRPGTGRAAGLQDPDRRSDQSVRDQYQRHLPRGFAEQQRLGGVRRRDLRVHQAVGVRRRDPLRRGSRQNTTDTPTQFLPAATLGTAHTGEVRKETFDARRSPRARCATSRPTTSPCTAAGAAGFAVAASTRPVWAPSPPPPATSGVHDVFQAEIADTWEVGLKSEFLDRRLAANLSLFDTKSHNGYFFYFDATTSTQNLGNLDARYKGLELELNGESDGAARSVCELSATRTARSRAWRTPR